MTVQVCRELDRDCGDFEVGWCSPCPKRETLRQIRMQTRATASTAICRHCKIVGFGWSNAEVRAGKRHRKNCVEYHCIGAFYGGSEKPNVPVEPTRRPK